MLQKFGTDFVLVGFTVTMAAFFFMAVRAIIRNRIAAKALEEGRIIGEEVAHIAAEVEQKVVSEAKTLKDSFGPL